MNIRANPQEDMLGIESLVTVRVDRDSFDDELFVYARSTLGKRDCPHCGADQAKVEGHGRDEGRFKDVATQGREKVTIVVDRARNRCTACGRTWTDRIEALRSRSGMTTRLEKAISKRCFEDTFMTIARTHGIDEGTVRNVFGRWADDKQKTHTFTTPRILGIDEIHLAAVPCVLVDVEKRKLYDILPSRNKANLGPYLAAMPDKENVEVVVADMWRGYHTLADEFFPGRLVVVDKFHVVRMANNGLDEVRKACGRSRSAEQRIRLKDERFLLGKRRATLSADEGRRVNAWLRAFPALRKAYDVKERFSDAFDAPSRALGERAIEKCLRSIPIELDFQFKELTTAVSNWKERICNYFETPATNAYTESVNSIIRELDRVGRGYAFETMRALMLFDETVRTKKTSTRGRRPEIPDDAYGFFGMDGFFGTCGDGVDDDADPDFHLDRLLARLALDPTVEAEGFE